MIGKTNAMMMGTDTSDATALASDIALNKIAYGSEGIPLTGTLEHLDTSDATATESDILLGKTAYAGGVELTGTLTTADLTGDATATADDILDGETAYIADGTKATGTNIVPKYAYCVDCRTISRENFTFEPGTGIKEFSFTPGSFANTVGAFQGNTNVVNITAPYNFSNLRNAFAGCTNLETVTLGNTAGVVDTGVYVGWGRTFLDCAKLHTISQLDMSGTTAAISNYFSTFSGCVALSNVTFVPNKIIREISFAQSPLLSTASLLSIANGLDAESAPKTLTMHTTSKTNMDAIMVDNNAGVAELGSAMTLTEFITTIKGWTIA